MDTSVKTTHTVKYKGFVFTIKGFHQYKFATNSKLMFEFSLAGKCDRVIITIGTKSKTTFKQVFDILIASVIENDREFDKRTAFKDMHTGLSISEKIAHKNFAYARFQPSGLGNYYNIYWKSPVSPTGVESVGGCSEEEWETISKATGNSHNYYSPTECKMTAH